MSGIAGIRHADVCTCHHCTDKRARIAAFGAIRRAAKVARECDFIANEHAHISYTDGEDRERDRARCIRQAIRHAIGSDKA